MREFLYKFLFEDLLLKVIALVFAVALVFIVRTELEASTALLLRVRYSEPRGRLLISEPSPPEQVKVLVRGPWGRVTRASRAALEPMRIDLAELSDGELRFSPEMARVPEGLNIESFDPPSVYLRFANEAKVALPVQLTTEGELQEGYRLRKTTLSPATVAIRGARSVIENMRNVQTRPLNIAGFTGSATVTAELGPLPKYAFYVEQPAPRITVDLNVDLVEKRFANVHINTSGAPQNARLNPESATIVLRGQSLEKLQDVPVLMVDTAADERKAAGTTYIKRIQVTGLPPGIAYEVTPRDVEVTVVRPAAPEKEPPRKVAP